MAAAQNLIFPAISFVISLLLFPVFIKILHQWKVFDSPGRHKIHDKFTPSMGGIPIVVGVVFSVLIALSISDLSSLKYFLIAIALMFLTGLRDDILTLSPTQKMVGQILPIVILVVFGQTTLHSLYELAPKVIFPQYVSWFVTVFTILILTNAYNLIDGIDGLAGAIGFLILLFLGIWFYSLHMLVVALMSLSFAASIFAFLIFNWQPSKIFMGDTGALTIGMLLSLLMIEFINSNHLLSATHPLKFKASISTAVCLLIIPIFDTLRVIILRLRKFQSPFKADRNHLHHQFLNLGFSHAQAVLFLVGINLVFIGMAWILRNQSDAVILPLVIVLCLMINYLLKYFQERIAKDDRES